jgi:signal transduction histidine kinase
MKLSQKIIIIFTSTLILSLAISITLGFYLGTQKIKDTILDQQIESTTQLMKSIDRILYERYLDINTISNLVTLRLALSDQSNVQAYQDALSQITRMLTSTGPWNRILVFDNQSNLKISTLKNQSVFSFDSQTQKAYQTALGGEIYYSDVIDFSGKREIIYSSPIINSETLGNPIIGVAVAYYPWAIIEELISGIGEESISLLTSSGTSIYPPKLDNTNHFGNNIHQNHPVIQAALEKHVGIGQFSSLHSDYDSLFSFVLQPGLFQYKGSNWILITETPVKAINSLIFQFITPLIILFSATLIALSIILFFFIKSSIVSPVSHLTQVVKKIQSGDLSARVEKISQNEIGQLGSVFNDMAASLSQLYYQMEEKVKERTEKLNFNLELVKKQNESLESNKKAILNILEDEKELEIALKKEKESVERKVLERTEELSNTKAKLSSSIENLPLGFLMTDIEENLVVTNALANQVLEGQNTNEKLLSLKNILKDKVDLSSYIKNCGVDKNRLNFDDIHLNNRYYQLMLSPVLTDNPVQACLGIVVLIQDITEAKIVARSKDEFFSIASHELRTPLTAIRGNTSMIQEYYADELKNPELADMISDIHQSSIRLINIVNDFLNVSRLEQGKMEYKISDFDITKVIPDVISEYAVTGSQHKISIEFIKPESIIPQVSGDQDKIRQVLVNLIGNALKFTQEGGVKVSLESDSKFVKVLITDTGRGIAPEQQNLLFRKFQQAGESLFTRDTTKGTGLGLYISKMMIEGMGGSIKLEKSVPDQGSVFSFSLPIASPGVTSQSA